MSGGARVTLEFAYGVASQRVAHPGFSASFSGLVHPGEDDLDDLLEQAEIWWDTGGPAAIPMKDRYEPNVKLIALTAVSILNEGTPVMANRSADIAGTYAVASDESAPDDCILLSMTTGASHTSANGRLVHTIGRMYLPPPPALEISADGIIDPTYGAAVQARAENLQTIINAAGPGSNWQLSVWRPTATPQTLEDVVKVRTAKVIGTQRKRKPKRQGYYA